MSACLCRRALTSLLSASLSVHCLPDWLQLIQQVEPQCSGAHKVGRGPGIHQDSQLQPLLDCAIFKQHGKVTVDADYSWFRCRHSV